jgi:iron complex outermembrane receptor protein
MSSAYSRLARVGRHCLSFVVAATLCLAPSPGTAQETEPSSLSTTSGRNETTPDETLYKLPPVVVTVDKRETEAQKTPMTLTVLDSQQLDDRGVTEIDDVLRRIPNLSVNRGTGGLTYMSFRGAPTTIPTETNPLVIYVDGVPADTFMNLDAPLMDVERIEVLRGPQSVMYGKNTFGGIINIISQKPDNTFRGKVFTRAESYEGYALGGTMSGPLKEDLLYLSLSAMHEQSEGYMHPEGRDRNNTDKKDRVKGMLRLTPSTQVDIALHGDYTQSRERPAYIKGNDPTLDSISNDEDFSDCDTLNLALTAEVDLDAMTAHSITTYRSETLDFQVFLNPVMPMANTSGRNIERQEFTQEFRVNSPEENKLQWLLGLYGSYTDLDVKNIYADYMPMGPWKPALNQPFKQTTKELTPFGQIEVPLTDSFHAVAGLRWYNASKSATIKYEPNSDMQALFGSKPMSTDPDESWNELLPRFALTWQVNPSDMVYAGVSRSAVPGGFNYAASTPSSLTYDSQTAWNYELGTKTGWFDNSLLANLSLFYSSFENFQIMEYNPTLAAYEARNAGEASSYGAELDLIWRILEGLDFDLSAGYTHARYDSYSVKDSTTGKSISYNDKHIPYTPTFSGTAGLQYRHSSGVFGRVEGIYSGKLYWDDANDYARDPITVCNARLGYEWEDFDVYLYGNNIFDGRYLQSFAATTSIGVMAPPQSFGVELAYRF